MSATAKFRPHEGAIIAVAIFSLPFLLLIPFGYYWLFEHGWLWLLAWTAATVVASGAALFVRRRALKRAAKSPAPIPLPDAAWSPKDDAAWTTVVQLTEAADATTVTTAEEFGKLAQKVVESVARHYRPSDKKAVWGFSLPEALLLTERVSHDMRGLVARNIPFGDQITVGMALRAYGWMPQMRKAWKFYDASYNLYRLYRIIPNIVAAGTNEIRARLSQELFLPALEATKTRFVRLLLDEIGRAAINLYSGRLRLSDDEIALYSTRAAQQDARRAPSRVEPIRIVLAGQINAGKSSLINALSGEVQAAVDVLAATPGFTAHRISRDGLPGAVFLDGPGLGGDSRTVDRLIGEAADCDLVLWTAQANRPARSIDRDALDRLRSAFGERPNRRRPPIILVLTHIDCLRPYTEWNPPYDLRTPTTAKARSIREAIAATCDDLGFDAGDVVPVCLTGHAAAYNVDSVWACILAAVPDARKAQLLRILTDAQSGIDWSRVWRQAVGGVREIGKALLPEERK